MNDTPKVTSPQQTGLTVLGLGTPRVEVLLDRPSHKNALNPEMINAINSTLAYLQNDQVIRVLIFRGSGNDFCAGADLNWMRDLSECSPDQISIESLPLQQMYVNLASLQVPVIGVAQGRVIAGGLGILAACDVVVATIDSKFTISEAKIGLLPALIAPLLIQRIGSSAFNELTLSGLTASARKMQWLGLVHYLADSYDQAQEVCKEIETSILNSSPDALSASKEMVQQLRMLSFDDGLLASLEWVRKTRGTTWATEGVQAFLQKRAPSWRSN